ncbi:hypothetical protein K474DRAFT_968772 [Panus rudis PR-1116 ss-1]|nr:hypothetical protein K474DRAFT_968772 [Panus rudis PR-1116 ss-1]
MFSEGTSPSADGTRESRRTSCPELYAASSADHMRTLETIGNVFRRGYSSIGNSLDDISSAEQDDKEDIRHKTSVDGKHPTIIIPKDSPQGHPVISPAVIPHISFTPAAETQSPIINAPPSSPLDTISSDTKSRGDVLSRPFNYLNVHIPNGFLSPPEERHGNCLWATLS